MNRAIAALTSAALVASWASAAGAHHTAVQYDFQKNATLTGTVKSFRPQNPHMQLILTVTDARGTRDLVFESHSVNNMIRQGFQRGMVKTGDKVTIGFAPLKVGEGGFFRSMEIAGGGFFGQKFTPRTGGAGAAAAAAEQKAAEGR